MDFKIAEFLHKIPMNDKFLKQFTKKEEIFKGISINFISLSLIFAFTFPLIRYFAVFYIFKPYGKRVFKMLNAKEKVDIKANDKSKDMYKVSGSNNNNNMSKENDALNKWEGACWNAFIYVLFSISALAVSYQKQWFHSSQHMWLGCRGLPCDYEVTAPIFVVYCMQVGYYLQAIPCVYFWDTKRKDILEVTLHHFVTLFLFLYSFVLNFTHVGTLMMLLHDICDIFMEIAKLCRYAQKNDASTVFFAIFVLVWICSRIIYFPLVIIQSSLKDPIEMVAIPFDVEPQPHYFIFMFLLASLLCIHAYWTTLIIKILYNVLVFKQDADDIREDEE